MKCSICFRFVIYTLIVSNGGRPPPTIFDPPPECDPAPQYFLATPQIYVQFFRLFLGVIYHVFSGKMVC